ncbi:MAG: serine/threonine protein kinase [Acidobacteriota bacterium]|nr:serine/threonine protein kinase [Acidobacteriota bacterium]
MPFRCVRCHAEIERAFKACPHCGEPVTDFLRRYADEPVDGKYRIIERLGAGGMGEVYKVEHVFLKAVRVIKVIRPQISEDADAHERFLREAQLATKVQHPNVATLHDFSALPDGSHYMVWEFIDGENLAQVIRKRGVIAPAYAIRLAIQALNGLDAVHRAGIIHRDISPENLMITRGEQPDERVKLIDLGVAKMDEGDYAATRTGIFVGKLRYSSPEQLGFLTEGQKLDGRADLYSLAIVIYEMLTGRPPFEATSPHQYILHHSQDTKVQSLDLTRIPAPLQPVLARALERDRTKRYATAREFADALEAVAPSLPTLDSDSTLRLTPPAGTTIRQPTTVRTDAVQKPPVQTLVEKPRRQTGLLIVIVLLVLAFGAFATWHFRSQPAAVATNLPKTVAPQPATTTVDVTPPAPVPVPVTVAAPEPAPTPVPKPVPAPVQPEPKKVIPQPEPVPEPQPAPAPRPAERLAAALALDPYVEGGDSSANEAALNAARAKLHGVTRVSVDSRGDADLGTQLANRLRGMNLTVADGSDVVVHFKGVIAHLRFGRKRRATEAVITKNGQPVFRYEMKPEEYRVGDNPAEAFARVLSDIFGR